MNLHVSCAGLTRASRLESDPPRSNQRFRSSPRKRGPRSRKYWIPACAGMNGECFNLGGSISRRAQCHPQRDGRDKFTPGPAEGRTRLPGHDTAVFARAPDLPIRFLNSHSDTIIRYRAPNGAGLCKSPREQCEGVERRKAPPRSHPPPPFGLRRAAPVTRARRLPALHLRLFCPRDRSFRVHTEGSCPPDPASFRRPSCAPRPAIQGRPP